MRDMRLAAALTALRRHKHLRQTDVARAAGVSASTVSRIERGLIDHVDVDVVRRVVEAVDSRLALVVRWHGGDLDRLVDERHSGLQESVARRVAALPSWIVESEVTFSIYGERGAIDLLAWHPTRRALLIIEVNSALDDVGGLLRQVDRYQRLAQRIAAERGWRPAVVGVWVVIEESRTARRRLAQHHAVIRSAFPQDGHDAAAWLRDPGTNLRALSFLPRLRPAHAPRRHERGMCSGQRSPG